MGFISTLVAVLSARYIFPRNAGIMSVAFISALLIPSINLLVYPDKALILMFVNEKKYSLRRIFRVHKDIFEVYFFLFFGVFLSYVSISIVFPEQYIIQLFPDQLRIAGLAGYSYNAASLKSILFNNAIIFLVCLILSLVYGAGAILFLSWNASVWGVIVGYFLSTSAVNQNQSFIYLFSVVFVPYLPHLLTEAISYISAAIAGGIISKAVIFERMGSRRFYYFISDAYAIALVGIVLMIIAAFIEVYFYAKII